MPYLEIAIAVVFASAMLKGGELERRRGLPDHGLLWAGLSLAVSAVAVAVFAIGALALIVIQLVLLVAIGAVRAKLAG